MLVTPDQFLFQPGADHARALQSSELAVDLSIFSYVKSEVVSERVMCKCDFFAASPAYIYLSTELSSSTKGCVASNSNRPVMAPSNGYGASSNSTAGNRTGAHGPADNEQPVSKSGWRKEMMVNVDRDLADIVLLMCYIITGLLDSASISTWGSFASMQTGSFQIISSYKAMSQCRLTEICLGNTIYIGLGLAAPNESKRWIKSGVSLISFCIGSSWFSRFHRYFTPSLHWMLCVSFLAQMGLIVVAAAILTWGPKSTNEKDEIGWSVLVPIALVAFQSSGQAVTSRVLKYNALTSVTLTSIYCDLFSDADLFAMHNAERNRRLDAPVLLLFGIIMGGLLTHSPIGIVCVLWIAAGLKLFVVLSWVFWRAAED